MSPRSPDTMDSSSNSSSATDSPTDSKGNNSTTTNPSEGKARRLSDTQFQKSVSMRRLESSAANRHDLKDQLQYRCRVLGGPSMSDQNVTSSLRLDFTSLPLYGRRVQKDALLQAMRGAVAAASKCVLLYGPTGVGKTTLVTDTLSELPIVFCVGRQEHSRPTAKPFGPIVQALQHMLGKVEKDRPEVCEAIQEVAADVQCLVGLLPKLGDILANARVVHNDTLGDSTKGKTKVTSLSGPRLMRMSESMSSLYTTQRSPPYLQRTMASFRALLRAAASPEHPLCLFLDDLQWADPPTLQLVNYLLQDPESEHVLFILSYGTPVTDQPSSLAKSSMKDYEVAGQLFEMETTIEPTYIPLEGLNFEVLNTMVAAVLEVPPNRCESLTAIVYNKTHGNCLHAQQYLGLLQDKGLLQYSLHSSEWLWDLDVIVADTDDESVLQARIDATSSEARHILSRAAFLGPVFEFSHLLRLLIQDSHHVQHSMLSLDAPGIQLAFQGLLKMGLLERTGTQGVFKFGHNQYQKLAYETVRDEKERARIHGRLGYILSDSMKTVSITRQPKWMVFSMMDQFNRGLLELDTINNSNNSDDDNNDHTNNRHCDIVETNPTNEQERLAHINFQAAKDAYSQSAFHTAAAYAQAGLHMLCLGRSYDTTSTTNSTSKIQDWPTDLARHEMAMKLALLEAEMYLHCQMTTQCQQLIERTILVHALDNTERVRAYTLLMQAMCVDDRIDDALLYGRQCLRKHLGISESSLRRKALTEIVKTKRMLRNMSPDDIINLSHASDPNRIGAIDILTEMCFCLCRAPVLAKTKLPPLVCKIVRLTLTCGLTQSAPYAFAVYGMLLCLLGKPDEGYRHGVLAVRLLDELDARSVASATIQVVHSTIFHFQVRARDSCSPLWSGYQMGLESGQVDQAFDNAMHYLMTSYCSNVPIGQLDQKIEQLTIKAREYRHTRVLPTLRHFHNLILCMTGRSLLVTGALHPKFSSPVPSSPEAIAMERWYSVETAYFLKRSSIPQEEAIVRKSFAVFQKDGAAENVRSLVWYYREMVLTALMALRLVVYLHKPIHDSSVHPDDSSEFPFLQTPPRKRQQLYRKYARQLLKLLQKHVARGAVDFIPAVALIQCEQAYLSLKYGPSSAPAPLSSSSSSSTAAGRLLSSCGRKQDPMAFRANPHESAIHIAEHHNAVWLAGLAAELTGIGCADPEESKEYLCRACRHYQDWGADTKIMQLINTHGGRTVSRGADGQPIVHLSTSAPGVLRAGGISSSGYYNNQSHPFASVDFEEIFATRDEDDLGSSIRPDENDKASRYLQRNEKQLIQKKLDKEIIEEQIRIIQSIDMDEFKAQLQQNQWVPVDPNYHLHTPVPQGDSPRPSSPSRGTIMPRAATKTIRFEPSAEFVAQRRGSFLAAQERPIFRRASEEDDENDDEKDNDSSGGDENELPTINSATAMAVSSS